MPVAFKEAFENYRRGIHPHPLFGFWRNLFQLAIGFSPVKSRIISAVMILTVVGTLGVISLALFRSWLALLPVVAVGLYPNTFMTARSLRFEQEIIFLGCLGLFTVPFLINITSSPRLRFFLMFLGGILIGWVATLHFWGLVFAVVLFTTMLAYPSLWKKEDGVGFFRRILAWGAGAALPVLLVLGHMAANRTYYADFTTVMSKLYEGREYMRASMGYISFLNKHLHNYILHTQAFFPYPALYYWGMGILAMVVLGYAFSSLLPGKSRDRIYVVLAAWLAVGFMVMFLVYPIGYGYFPYPALAITLGFSWIVLALWERPQGFKSRLWDGFRLLLLFLLFSLVIMNGAYAVIQTYLIDRQDKAHKLISLDTRFQAIAQMAELTGINRQDGPVFCDLMTWIGGGRDYGSLFETVNLLLTPAPSKVGGVIIELQSFQVSILRHGKLHFGPIEERLKRFEEMLAPLSLAGVIFEKNHPKIYYFYQKSPPPHLFFGIIQGEKVINWAQSSRQGGISGAYDGRGQAIWKNLSGGYYALRLHHNDRLEYLIEVVDSADQRELKQVKAEAGPLYRGTDRLVLLEVNSRQGNILVKGLESVADATLLPLEMLSSP